MDEEIDSKFILFSPWTFILILLVFILGNLFIIDTALFLRTNRVASKQIAVKPTQISPSPTNPIKNGCDTDCKEEIQKAVAAAVIKPPATTTQSHAKEFFITLGSGSSNSQDWTDVPGTQSYIDGSSYEKIKAVTFEASLYTPTGNQTAYARLYNVTDSHPVWNSEVLIEGGTPQLRISSPITLEKSSKLYQIQMKTQLQSRTNLENARIHITTF